MADFSKVNLAPLMKLHDAYGTKGIGVLTTIARESFDQDKLTREQFELMAEALDMVAEAFNHD
jgi:hypothetical protein